MIATIGFGILVVTFLMCFYGIGAALYGGLKNRQDWVESARRAQLLTFPLLSMASLALVILLLTGAYEVAFVYGVTQNAMEPYLRATAWWGGQAGSLLFWSWLLSAFTTAFTIRKWDRDRGFLPWVIVVSLV